MTAPLISVLVPVYNIEKYLNACLDSIINQKYENIEIIIVDDGSTDNSSAICDSYVQKDRRIKVFQSDNTGIASARNLLLEKATGEYIAFVDSDDVILPDMYSAMIKTAIETESDIVLCNFDIVSPDGTIMEPEYDMPFAEGEIAVTDYISTVSSGYCGLLSIVWNKLYKRHVFEGIRYPDGKIHEDDATIHRIIHNCNKIFYLDKKYYRYRKHKTSIMNKKFSSKRLDSTDAVLDRLTFFAENRYDEKIIHKCELFLVNDFIESIRKLNKKSISDRIAIKKKYILIKPYCKKLLNNPNTSKEDKKTIRYLMFYPYLFFYI